MIFNVIKKMSALQMGHFLQIICTWIPKGCFLNFPGMGNKMGAVTFYFVVEQIFTPSSWGT